MKSIYNILFLIGVFTSISSQGYSKGCGGKIDLAPAYAHIDVLESGKTIHRMDLAAVKADMTCIVWKGLCLKPTVLYGEGHGHIVTTGIGLGFIIPILENLCITPVAGYNYTYLRTHISVRTPFGPLGHFKERFRSNSPYIGIEGAYTFYPCWRVYGCIQYAWSRTHTTIKPFVDSKSHSDGANYAVMLEHDLNDQWSVNVGGAYNLTLSKEKHGLRGAGVKLGLARWF